MWIAAQSNIRLLRGVPLDPTYDHTIYFSSAQEQAAHFINYTKYNLTTYVYQRVNKGSIRVAILADYLYDCNYMMFKNDAYGNKWFYAFITSAEYINDNVTEIRYEMDDLQTWHFDYTIDECFVEREHSLTDNIGDNTLPEDVETGPFKRYAAQDFGNFDGEHISIVMFITSEANGTPTTGIMLHNIYTCVSIREFSTTDSANNFISAMTEANRQDNILAIYHLPRWMLTSANRNTTQAVNNVFNYPVNNSYIDGYQPKNNKLFTGQFKTYMITNNNGSSHEYLPELLDTSQGGTVIPINYQGTFATGVPVAIAFPSGYKGSRYQNDIIERLTIDSFPIGPYNIDGYKAWWAENQGSFIGGLISDSARTLSSNAYQPIMNDRWASSPGPKGLPEFNLGPASNLLSTISNTLGKKWDYQRLPPSTQQIGCSNSLAAFGKCCFTMYTQSIKAEFARCIDDYFTKFGYKTNRVKVPNRSSRPYFNYTKTIGCTITGSIPGDSARKICRIYDDGVTWWKPNAVIGNYDVDNSP